MLKNLKIKIQTVADVANIYLFPKKRCFNGINKSLHTVCFVYYIVHCYMLCNFTLNSEQQ